MNSNISFLVGLPGTQAHTERHHALRKGRHWCASNSQVQKQRKITLH